MGYARLMDDGRSDPAELLLCAGWPESCARRTTDDEFLGFLAA